MDTFKAYGVASSRYAISDIACDISELLRKEKNDDARKTFDRVLKLLDIKRLYYDAQYDAYMKE